MGVKCFFFSENRPLRSYRTDEWKDRSIPFPLSESILVQKHENSKNGRMPGQGGCEEDLSMSFSRSAAFPGERNGEDITQISLGLQAMPQKVADTSHQTKGSDQAMHGSVLNYSMSYCHVFFS